MSKLTPPTNIASLTQEGKMLNNLNDVLLTCALSTHTKTQEGEPTLQHTEIVAGFLRKMFYPIFIIALMTVFTSCKDDENNISPIGENYVYKT